MSEPIQTTREGGIVTITLNNPDKRNALTMQAWSSLALKDEFGPESLG